MAAAAAAGGLDARITAALPAGVNLEDLRGLWMLDATGVKFETETRGRTRVLGRGASGIVFAGTYCTEPAAIKQVFPVTAGDVNGWLTEVKTQYRIRVDGVLTVHGALLDIDDAGRLLYYIVMQRVPGCMLSLVLSPWGALAGANIPRRIHWLCQAAAALASLHARRTIHGDVKPANIMLSSADEAEAAVRVADFGAALVRSPGAGTLTTHRGERGSMVYMDPVLFDGGSVTPASDTYSWAMTAWQVLSGAVPYAAELAASGVTSEAMALDALRRHVRGATDQRPSVVVLRERGVLGAVIDVIQWCWAATPAARPPMAEVAAALAIAQMLGSIGRHLQPPPAVGPAPLVYSPAVESSIVGGPQSGIPAELTAALPIRELVVAGLEVLESLESDAERVGCVEEGAGVAAKDVLAGFPDDLYVARVICRALANLTFAADYQMLLVRDGAHVTVMAAAGTHVGDVEVARAACVALCALAVSVDNRVRLVRDGAHTAVMAAALSHAGDVEVARWACGALASLAAADGLAVPLVRDGAHMAVMATARAHGGDVEVARDACGALANLAVGADNKVLLVRDGAHMTVMAAARVHAGDVEVARVACGTLQNLAIADDNCVPLVCDGAHMAVMTAARVHAGDVEVVWAACAALLSLAAATDNCVPLVRDGAHTAVMTAARAHAGDVDVARAACGTLLSLTGPTENKVPLARDGVHTAVMAVARAHSGDVAVAQVTCGVLSSLAGAADNRVPLVRDGAHTSIMTAARAHIGDVEMAKVACCALAILSFAPDCRDSLARDGAREFLVFVSGRHPRDAEVQKFCRCVQLPGACTVQ